MPATHGGDIRTCRETSGYPRRHRSFPRNNSGDGADSGTIPFGGDSVIISRDRERLREINIKRTSKSRGTVHQEDIHIKRTSTSTGRLPQEDVYIKRTSTSRGPLHQEHLYTKRNYTSRGPLYQESLYIKRTSASRGPLHLFFLQHHSEGHYNFPCPSHPDQHHTQ